MDGNHSGAWFLKGKAAGWQSSLANVRIEESMNCFAKSLECVEENEKEILKQLVAEEIKKLSLALMMTTCDNFSKFPTADNSGRVLSSYINITLYSFSLLVTCGVVVESFSEEFTLLTDQSILKAWNQIVLPDYENQGEHKTTYGFDLYIERGDLLINLYESFIAVSTQEIANNTTL